MAGFLVQLALSNLLVSAMIALVAYAVHRRGRYPVVAHLLWVLVLVKSVTPPILALTIPSVSVVGSSGPLADAAANVGATAGPALDALVPGLLAVWAVGSIAVFVLSLGRIVRFDRLVRRTSAPAGPHLRWLAEDVAHRMSMRRAPALYVTHARISPMTWWTGGRVRVILPASLSAELESDQLRWVLAHEFAHVQRHDHLVRWLEWIACVTFWWNPVAWFARANLREDEEAACDALVLERLGAGTKPYARALLAVVENLSRAGMQPPGVATGIDGGSLERRFRILVGGRSARPVPRRLLTGLLALSVLVMPLGVGVETEQAPTQVATIDTWMAAAIQPSAAEASFLSAMPSRRPADTVVQSEALTAPVSATIKADKPAARKSSATARKAEKASAKKARKANAGKARKARARKARSQDVTTRSRAAATATPALPSDLPRGSVIRF
jgi:beta-lactamase regulating signal transducer with metallopeptidase domain